MGSVKFTKWLKKNYKDNWAWAFFTIGNFGFGQWLFRYKQTCHKKFETVFGKVQLRSCICKLGKEEGLGKNAWHSINYFISWDNNLFQTKTCQKISVCGQTVQPTFAGFIHALKN